MINTTSFRGIAMTDTIEYPLEFFDRLISESLDPDRIDKIDIDNETFDTINKHLKQEDSKLQFLIKSQTFSLNEKETVILVRRYRSNLIKLLAQANGNKQQVSDELSEIIHIYEQITDSLDKLLLFIENWYADFVGLDEPVSPCYLAITKKELKKSEERLKKKLEEGHNKPALRLVLKRLHTFINRDSYPFEVNFRALIYKKELVAKFENLPWETDPAEVCRRVHELLIYMNYNSKAYIRLLTSEILKEVNKETELADRLDRLLFYQKSYQHIHPKPDVVLNPKYHSLQSILSSWFTQEVKDLERIIKLENGDHESKPTDLNPKNKILCKLSSDQIGLFIRALDEARVVIAKSMSAVFRAIVPHLSTQQKENLSFKAMQSKTYAVEERDKQIIIEWLEKIIEIIKSY